VAVGEPEATLRAEALASVEIRRPDLRALSRWMSDAKMATATLITRGGEIEAVLFLPTYEGIPDLTLEEARALRELADELAPLCHARAKLARSMVREQTARREADEAITRAERLEHQLARASAHHALAAARLARPAAVGIYAARSRTAYEALERLTKAQAPIAIVAPSGVDPVPFLARAHLAGARMHAPLVLVDATSTREHDLARWRDPVASPLELADGGVLVLLDCAALPIDIQRLVGQSLAERRAPWERADALDIVVAITTTQSPHDLVEAGHLDPLLASRLGAAIDDAVHLAGIADRPEDIRALVTDRLAREGLRVRGAPIGIDDAAFALLVEHPFEGEDAELTSIVQRLVARAHHRASVGEGSGDVIREADVRATLGPEPDASSLSRERRA
jgi:DNA-binding NtrC family response regulator